VLRTIWRWSYAQDPTIALDPYVIESIGQTFCAGNGQILAILKTNSFLTMAISLGLRVDIHDLYPPNDKCVISYLLYKIPSWRTSDTLKAVSGRFRLRPFVERGCSLEGQGQRGFVLSGVITC